MDILVPFITIGPEAQYIPALLWSRIVATAIYKS